MATKTSKSSKVFLAVAIVIIIIIILAVILYFATRGSILAPSPLYKIQRTGTIAGSDTLAFAGNVTYYAAPTGSDVTLTIPASLNNAAGTVIQVKNESATGGRNIVVRPDAGVTIAAGGYPTGSYLTVGPAAVATYIAVATNSYVRT